MEIKLNITAEQAQQVIPPIPYAPQEPARHYLPVDSATFGCGLAADLGAPADDLLDVTCGHCEHVMQQDAQAEALWVTDVQVAVLSMAGVGVEDEQTARDILADLFGLVGPYEQPMQAEGCGVWLVSVPQHVWDELEAEGGTLLTHSAGYVVEIPMP